MKKLALTIAVVIGVSLTTFANNDGGTTIEKSF